MSVSSGSIVSIRPYQVLRIPDRFDDEIKFFMPQAQGQGSTSTIESIMLIKLLRIVDAAYVFEFGTYKGLTTRILLENLPDQNVQGPRLFTLDLPNLEGVSFQGTDKEVALESVSSERKYLKSQKRDLVQQILQDCLTFDERKYHEKFQFIFIDGNHELKYVQSDTEKSLRMIAREPSCIVWHDYGNPEFPELTSYVNEIAAKKRVYHIEDTMLAFILNGMQVPPRDS
jgi:hypothetical protein